MKFQSISVVFEKSLNLSGIIKMKRKGELFALPFHLCNISFSVPNDNASCHEHNCDK